MRFIKTIPIRILLNPLILKDFPTLSNSLTHNQVLRKLVKLHNSQNVNCDDRSSKRVTSIVLGEALLSGVTLTIVVANLFAYEYSMGRRFLRESSTIQLECFKTLSKIWRVSFFDLVTTFSYFVINYP